ncbi:cell division protein FtsL [Azospirillum doebereinerae]
MKGKTWLFWGGLIAAAGGVLFQTSYDVQDLEEKLAGLNRKIVTEQESIQVLKAEWSYLNDPTKLEELATAHLALQPIEARQFLALDMIPMRPAPAPDAVAAPVPGRGLTPVAPPMAGLPAPQLASARVPAARVPMEAALEKAPVIIPAALSAPAPVKPAPIKPSALVPASARAPALPPAPAAATPGKLAPNAPLPSLNRPTDVASRDVAPRPAPAPAPIKLTPAKPQAYTPKPTDSLGLLVARLGANQ